MKKNSLFLLCSFFCWQSFGQNLIVNGDFESYYKCPISYERRSYQPLVPGWASTDGGTPDYFHRCSDDAGIPYSWAGKNQALVGNGFIGIYTWGGGYREFIKGEISDTLIEGNAYIFSFQYLLASYAEVAIDRIGAQIIYNDGSRLLLEFSKDSVVDKQTGKWETAADTLIANGKEMAVVIGNFSSDEKTGHYFIPYRQFLEPMLRKKSYYLIDNVSLTPVLPPVPALETDKVYALNDVKFAFDSDILLSESVHELEDLYRFLSQNNHTIHIRGHTDELGTETYNLQLSERRARAVTQFLIEQGLNPARITFEGKGEKEPLFMGSDEATRSKNRRVEFVIHER